MIANRFIQYCLASLLVMAFVFTMPKDGRAAEIQPSDVYRLVQQVNREIEHLRWFMGRPKNRQPPPRVSGVSPYEVYDQAVTLYRKADRLAFEISLENRPAPPPPLGKIEPRHVHAVVELTLERLRFIGAFLETPSDAVTPKRDADRTPTDVFKAIIQANRQLNLMLAKQFQPADVFEQVSTALSYADSILATLPDTPPPPLPTPMEPGKRPADVFNHLLKVYELVARLGEKYDRRMLRIHQWTDDEEFVRPGDVYDLASVITAELNYVHKRTKDAKKPVRVVHKRLIFPSDVCHRVSVLETILLRILERMP